MPIVTTAFRKLAIERTGEGSSRNVKIKSNINIKEILKADLVLGDMKRSALKFQFEFVTDYEPKYASIRMEGDVIYFTAQERIDEILKNWKKDKTAPKDISAEVINHLLTRCNIQALILSRELNLPSPVQLPRVQAK